MALPQILIGSLGLIISNVFFVLFTEYFDSSSITYFTLLVRFLKNFSVRILNIEAHEQYKKFFKQKTIFMSNFPTRSCIAFFSKWLFFFQFHNFFSTTAMFYHLLVSRKLSKTILKFFRTKFKPNHNKTSKENSDENVRRNPMGKPIVIKEIGANLHFKQLKEAWS